jgi:hypothetical protein
MLWPFTGVVQVAELDWARALSLDGITWSLRYAEDEESDLRKGPMWYNPGVYSALEVTIDGEHLEIDDEDSDLSEEEVEADSQKLVEALDSSQLPFEAADHYEYWLLDEKEERPLVLLYSCVDAEDRQQPVPPPIWRAMPESNLSVQDPQAPEQASNEHSVYYRLEKLVKVRAGSEPRAAWFQRREGDGDDFPPMLLREDWEDEEAERLCRLYLRRLAPRLLMLPGLPEAKRQWLEQAALENPFDVEQFFRLYPEEVDRKFITAARVQARMLQSDQV